MDDSTSQALAARGAEASRRVALFVDYESLSFGLQDSYGADQSKLELCARLKEVAQRYGRVVLANAYGDWTTDLALARSFQRCQISPVLVLHDDDDDSDRPDLGMSLDALETLHVGPEFDVYVLATSDEDFQELTSRLKRADRAVIVCGLESNTSAELKEAADDFVSLEGLLGLEPGQPIKRIDFSMYDWGPFIQFIDSLEAKMPFVGVGWLLNKKLNNENSGCESSQEKQQVMDRAVEEGILSMHKIDNVDAGGDPVSACKLNRDNPLVKDFTDS